MASETPRELEGKKYARVFGPWRDAKRRDKRVHGVLCLEFEQSTLHIYYVTNSRTTFFYLASSCCYDLYSVPVRGATSIVCRRCSAPEPGRWHSYLVRTPEVDCPENVAIVEYWLAQKGMNVLGAALLADGIVEDLFAFASGTAAEEYEQDCNEPLHA